MKSSLINAFLASIFIVQLAHANGVEDLFKQMSEIKEPFKLRDPFQAPKLKKPEKRQSTTPIRNGVFTNVPSIGDVELSKIQITGVLIGPERRAFVKVDGDKENTYTVKEGMSLGKNSAEIKAILPGGVILVERVTNIYGQTEYLETVIPISK